MRQVQVLGQRGQELEELDDHVILLLQLEVGILESEHLHKSSADLVDPLQLWAQYCWLAPVTVAVAYYRFAFAGSKIIAFASSSYFGIDSCIPAELKQNFPPLRLG